MHAAAKEPAIQYTPPPTHARVHQGLKPGELFYDWIVGPVGSGKTTGIFFKLIYMAQLQARARRHPAHARGDRPQHHAAAQGHHAVQSWNYWFKHGQAGDWEETNKKFTLRSTTSSARCCSGRSIGLRTSRACCHSK
jgi:hypothetical protein